MSIFSTIMNKIFHPHAQPAAQPAAPQPAPAQAAQPAAAAPAPAPAAPAQPVDVEAVLSNMAAQKDEELNWRTSIVDLLKLLDLDSSLQARKELAQELDVHAGEAGTSEQNIALQKAVMQKLADNGGHVPDSLKAA